MSKGFYIAFVFFSAAASMFAQQADSLARAFAVCSNDSVFIAQHSQKPFRRYTIERRKPDSPAPDESVGLAVFQAGQGQMLGPFEGKKTIQYYKILRVDSGTRVSMKHILLDKNSHPASWIDSTSRMILSQSKNGDDLDKFCWEYSDPGSGTQPGSCDLKNEYAEDYVAPVRDACRQGKAGEIICVSSEFGKHIIMLTAPPQPMRRRVEYAILSIPKK